jgi:hypothetical protein
MARKIKSIKNSSDPIGDQTAIFWLVTQFLNQLCHHIPPISLLNIENFLVINSVINVQRGNTMYRLEMEF